MDNYFLPFKSIFVLISISLFLQTCQSEKLDTSVNVNSSPVKLKTNKQINSIEVYCWCFSLFPYQYHQEAGGVVVRDYLNRIVRDINICQTPTNVTVRDLQENSTLRTKLEGTSVMKVFQDSLLNSFNKKSILRQGGDARLAFQVNFEDGSKSMLTYHSKNRIILDDTISLDFTYRIDSLLLRLDSSLDFICPN